MKKIIILLVLFFLKNSLIIAQDAISERSFLGFGWVVAISNDLIFVPSSSIDKIPKSKDFFKEKNKNGFRIEFLNSAYSVLDYGKSFSIKYEGEKSSSLNIVPVIATYLILENNIKSEEYFMKRIYYYKDKLDSVQYSFGINLNIDIRAIGK
jgi:hypothetical protein